MHLSIKYEWFRDWFRTGFVWFRVFLYLLSWTEKIAMAKYQDVVCYMDFAQQFYMCS